MDTELVVKKSGHHRSHDDKPRTKLIAKGSSPTGSPMSQ
jgi:hypothetical protein